MATKETVLAVEHADGRRPGTLPLPNEEHGVETALYDGTPCASHGGPGYGDPDSVVMLASRRGSPGGLPCAIDRKFTLPTGDDSYRVQEAKLRPPITGEKGSSPPNGKETWASHRHCDTRGRLLGNDYAELLLFIGAWCDDYPESHQAFSQEMCNDMEDLTIPLTSPQIPSASMLPLPELAPTPICLEFCICCDGEDDRIGKTWRMTARGKGETQLK